MKEEIIITQGKYIASAVRADQYPEGDLPEVVFIGQIGRASWRERE